MDASLAFPVLIGLIVVALFFDFLNGLHDAANSIATIVSTRVLRPQYAVFWAAFFNFIAFLFFGLHVAETLGTGIIDASIVDPLVIFAALVGAIVWNVVDLDVRHSVKQFACADRRHGRGRCGESRWWSNRLERPPQDLRRDRAVAAHRLRARAGAGARGLLAVRPPVTLRASTAHFAVLQFVSASLYSLGHGGNDAQKTMGIIAVLLYSQGHLGDEFYVPFWVVISCQAALALGTLFGGWRIVHTMGSKITRLNPMQGFCAETGGAITLFTATWLGIPVSTTHTITGAIIGVGAARRASAVRWGLASNIVVAWVITLPVAALIAALAYAAVAPFT